MKCVPARQFANTASGRKTRSRISSSTRVSVRNTGSSLQRERNGVEDLNKYGNRKTMIDGITFDSAKEAQRWAELKLLERAGQIFELQRQVPFVLVPKQERDGKVIERPVVYRADFVYTENGKEVVEDVKSPATKTKEYILKRKLMLWEYGIQIREV